MENEMIIRVYGIYKNIFNVIDCNSITEEEFHKISAAIVKKIYVVSILSDNSKELFDFCRENNLSYMQDPNENNGWIQPQHFAYNDKDSFKFALDLQTDLLEN